MSDDRKDDEWLKRKLVGLLEEASAVGEKDAAIHGACAKYAELLYKMLPKGEKQPEANFLDRLRKKAVDGSG